MENKNLKTDTEKDIKKRFNLYRISCFCWYIAAAAEFMTALLSDKTAVFIALGAAFLSLGTLYMNLAAKEYKEMKKCQKDNIQEGEVINSEINNESADNSEDNTDKDDIEN